MKKFIILGILFLFYAGLFAQTELSSTSIRKSQISVLFGTPIITPIFSSEQVVLLSGSYTHFIGQHGISFGMFYRRQLSMLNVGRKDVFPIGFEAGYKYAFRKQVYRKWQPYAFYAANFYHKYPSSAAMDLNFAYNIYTNMLGVGMSQRLYKHLNFDVSISEKYAIWDYYNLNRKYWFLAHHLRVGLVYQFWK